MPQALPADYLMAAIRLARTAPRDENGFLTPESRRAVLAAYGMVDGTVDPELQQPGAPALGQKAVHHDISAEGRRASREMRQVAGASPEEGHEVGGNTVWLRGHQQGLSEQDRADTMAHYERTAINDPRKGKAIHHEQVRRAHREGRRMTDGEFAILPEVAHEWAADNMAERLRADGADETDVRDTRAHYEAGTSRGAVDKGKAINPRLVADAVHAGRRASARGENRQGTINAASDAVAAGVDPMNWIEHNATVDRVVERVRRETPEKGKHIKALRLKYRHKHVDKVAASMARDAARRATDRGAPPDEADWAAQGELANLENWGFLNPGHFRATHRAATAGIPGLAAVRDESRRTVDEMEGRTGDKEIHITRKPHYDPVVEDMLLDAERGDRTARDELANRGETDRQSYEVRLHGAQRLHRDDDSVRQHPPEGTWIRYGRGRRAGFVEAAQRRARDYHEDTGDEARIVDHTAELGIPKRTKEIHINPVPPYEGPELDMIQDAEAGDEDARRALRASDEERNRIYELTSSGTAWYEDEPGPRPARQLHRQFDRSEDARDEADYQADHYDTWKHPKAPPATIHDNTRPRQKSIAPSPFAGRSRPAAPRMRAR